MHNKGNISSSLIIVILVIIIVGGGAYLVGRNSGDETTADPSDEVVNDERESNTEMDDNNDESRSTDTTVDKRVTSIDWLIEDYTAQPGDNAYEEVSDEISIKVHYSDGSSKTHYLGNSAGCQESSDLPELEGKTTLGYLNCYALLSGVTYTAYLEGETLYVERYKDDASGRTDGTREIVLEI